MKNQIAFALLMGIITTGIISCALIAILVGFGPAFLGTWLRSWGLAYLVVIPIILLVAPRVQALVDRRFAAAGRSDELVLRRICFALGMGVITTGIISFALISVNFGFGPAFLPAWLRSWGLAYLAVVPALLFIAPWVRSRVDRWFGEPPPPRA